MQEARHLWEFEDINSKPRTRKVWTSYSITRHRIDVSPKCTYCTPKISLLVITKVPIYEDKIKLFLPLYFTSCETTQLNKEMRQNKPPTYSPSKFQIESTRKIWTIAKEPKIKQWINHCCRDRSGTPCHWGITIHNSSQLSEEQKSSQRHLKGTSNTKAENILAGTFIS